MIYGIFAGSSQQTTKSVEEIKIDYQQTIKEKEVWLVIDEIPHDLTLSDIKRQTWPSFTPRVSNFAKVMEDHKSEDSRQTAV